MKQTACLPLRMLFDKERPVLPRAAVLAVFLIGGAVVPGSCRKVDGNTNHPGISTKAVEPVALTPTALIFQTSTPYPPTQTPTVTVITLPERHENRLSPVDGMEMVFIKEGDFLMGSAESDLYASEDERPQREVWLDSYWIDRTEVSQKMYAQFLNDSPLSGGLVADWIDISRGDSHIILIENAWAPEEGFEDLPAAGITWEGARAYCQWAGRRLPTEAEWEKAARGVDGRVYPSGNDTPGCEQVQYEYCDDFLLPVDSLEEGASPYGVLNLSGNALEWVADWYARDYYAAGPLSNPAGPLEGIYRVQRGGSAGLGVLREARTTARMGSFPENAGRDAGFRCAADPGTFEISP